MNRYPLWKNLLVIVIVLVGLLFAMPNLFGDSPAVQITKIGSANFPPSAMNQAKAALAEAGVKVERSTLKPEKAIIVFPDSETQLRGSEVIKDTLSDDFSVALNLVPDTPEWMQAMGLQPMPKGLDLVGGIYFRLRVDIQAAVHRAMENQLRSIRSTLREAEVRYTKSSLAEDSHALKFALPGASAVAKAKDAIADLYPRATFTSYEVQDHVVLKVLPSSTQLQEVRNTAVTQNVVAIRRRVNQLGVSEPIVQRQGDNSIIVELPGMRNVARAKQRLGDTATIQFRLVYQKANPRVAKRTGQIPLKAELFPNKTRGGAPILLKRKIVASGPEITDASASFDQNSASWAVNISLNSAGADRMAEVTRHHLGDPMAVLYIQNRSVIKHVNGKKVQTTKHIAKVINVATIRGVFSNRFQITGLQQEQAESLALTLRTPLAAPVTIVAERTIGPSMGQQNIRYGLYAVALGFILVVVGMALYYKVFGLIADAAIIMNLILLVALMSMLQATLTLPGIAGILLTLGMAVDANVLINERIREELRVGVSPQAAIEAGYRHALTAIVDANITTLIAALVLFTIGSGSIKGFAVVLSLGIATSLFTSIMGTRAIVNAVFGGRKLKRLPV